MDSSKLKAVADDIFTFNEYSRKCCKLVENTVGKGEIAYNEQFLIYPQCFQKQGLVWERVNSLPNDKILDLSKLKAFADENSNEFQKLSFVLGGVKNIVGKGENAGYQHFLLFPPCFHKGFLYRVVKSRDFVVKG